MGRRAFAFLPLSSVSDRIRGGTDTAEGANRYPGWRAGIPSRSGTSSSARAIAAGISNSRRRPPAGRISPPPGSGTIASSSPTSSGCWPIGCKSGSPGGFRISRCGRRNSPGGVSRYLGLTFQSPPQAKTGDVSAAYFVPASGTKLRAHTGNGYRAPSIFERFGSIFRGREFRFAGRSAAPARAHAGLRHGRRSIPVPAKAAAQRNVVLHESPGDHRVRFVRFPRPVTRPVRAFRGYINTGGGIARGAELSAEASPLASLKIRAAYTYTNADVRRSVVRDRDFFEMPFTSPHQFSLVATQRVGRRIDLVGDLWIASRHAAIFSCRAFLFAGPRKLDLVANYTIPVERQESLAFLRQNKQYPGLRISRRRLPRARPLGHCRNRVSVLKGLHMSIATMRGDGGETGLAGGIRVSKSSDRVEAYGTIDELISTMGFARSICADEEIGALTKAIQKELFKVGSAIATPPEGAKKPPEITDEMVDALTGHVHRIEAVEGILADWSIPGEHTGAAAYDVARTVCRRAERLAVAVRERGIEMQPNVLALSQPAVGLALAIRPFAGIACGRECQAAGRCACRPAMVASLVMSVVEAVNRQPGRELRVKIRALLRQRVARKARCARPLRRAAARPGKPLGPRRSPPVQLPRRCRGNS